MLNLARLSAMMIAGSASVGGLSPAEAETFEIAGKNGVILQATRVATFDEPWAMTFLEEPSTTSQAEVGMCINACDTVHGNPSRTYF